VSLAGDLNELGERLAGATAGCLPFASRVMRGSSAGAWWALSGRWQGSDLALVTGCELGVRRRLAFACRALGVNSRAPIGRASSL
jgi:hypothetical protein